MKRSSGVAATKPHTPPTTVAVTIATTPSDLERIRRQISPQRARITPPPTATHPYVASTPFGSADTDPSANEMPADERSTHVRKAPAMAATPAISRIPATIFPPDRPAVVIFQPPLPIRPPTLRGRNARGGGVLAAPRS